jgi:hypothetical protein
LKIFQIIASACTPFILITKISIYIPIFLKYPFRYMKKSEFKLKR